MAPALRKKELQAFSPLKKSCAMKPTAEIPQEPKAFPAIELLTASYQKVWVRQSNAPPRLSEVLVSPSTGLAYMKSSGASGNVNPNRNKPIYKCLELFQAGDGIYEFTERAEVVIKAVSLSQREIEQVSSFESRRPRRRGGDEPIEELKAMSYLGSKAGNHCLVPLLDSFLDKEGWLYIVQPFYERKDLVEVLSYDSDALDLCWIRSMVIRLAEALRYLKQQGVAHMDISPENCFVDEAGDVFLGDLGMALFVGTKRDEDKEMGSRPAVSAAGGEEEASSCRPSVLLTPQAFRGKSAYHGKEVYAQKAFDPFAADIFSLGCTLFAVLTGRLLIEPAYHRDSHRPRFDALCREDFEALFKFEGSAEMLPPPAASLIKGMTQPDYKKRLTIEEVLAHPWIVSSDSHE